MPKPPNPKCPFCDGTGKIPGKWIDLPCKCTNEYTMPETLPDGLKSIV